MKTTSIESFLFIQGLIIPAEIARLSKLKVIFYEDLKLELQRYGQSLDDQLS